MTDAQRRAVSKVGGTTAIVIFTMGASWAWNQKLHNEDETQFVTRYQWIADSARRDAQINAVVMRLDQIIQNGDVSGQRLKEICEKVRAGCR